MRARATNNAKHLLHLWREIVFSRYRGASPSSLVKHISTKITLSGSMGWLWLTSNKQRCCTVSWFRSPTARPRQTTTPAITCFIPLCILRHSDKEQLSDGGEGGGGGVGQLSAGLSNRRAAAASRTRIDRAPPAPASAWLTLNERRVGRISSASECRLPSRVKKEATGQHISGGKCAWVSYI